MDATRRATRAVGAGLTVVSLAAVLVVVIRTGGDGEVSLGTGTTATVPPATTGSTATAASSGYVGGPTHTRLIVPGDDGRGGLVAQVVEVDEGTHGAARVTGLSGAAMWRPAIVGGRLVVADAGTAWVFDDPLRPPRALSGPHAALEVFASAAPGRVWLVALDLAGAGGGTVWEVDLTGRVTTPERRFEPRRVPVAAVTSGLVREVRTEAYGVGIEIWDPRTGAVVRTVAGGDALVLDASGTSVVWLSGSDGLHVTDTVTGRDVIVGRPSDGVAFSTFARLTPDGRRLVVDTVDAAWIGGTVPSLWRYGTDVPMPGSLAVVDLERDGLPARLVPGSRSVGSTWRRNAVWSPGGEWLFFATTVVSDLVSPPDDFSLFAHRWGAEGVIRIPAPLSAGSLLATTATTEG